MKFFAVFSAIVAVALASSPATWTLHELSEAIQNPNTHVSLIPILEDALNQLMAEIVSGSPQTTTTVSTAVQDFTSWTLHELSEALQDPATDPALVPYLEYALNTMISNIMAGESQDYIIVATPVGLLPIEQAIVPVVPVETPVVPAPVESIVTPAASSPLVQIIVNIKSQQEEAVAPTPVPVPSPAVDDGSIPVIPRPVPVPSPIVPAPVVLPQPILPVVIPQPVVHPEPMVPIPNPVDIIAINPDVSVNPIDVIAITAPEVNPVDLISPVPVVSPVGVVGVVGPMI